MQTTPVLRALTSSLLLVACSGAPSTAPTPAPTRATTQAQTILDEELAATTSRSEVVSALAVMLDPRDGHVLAMQSVDGATRDPELPARERRSHGSVGKTFTYAIALDRGVIAPSDRFDGMPVTVGGEAIHDGEDRASMSVEDALAFSSNVGAVHVFERLGRADLLGGLRALHLDAAVPPAAADDELVATRVAYGPALEATPLEIASAFAAVVNGGTYHAPWQGTEAPSSAERVLSAESSSAMRALLEAAVARDDGTGHLARVDGVRVGGKTGTMPRSDGGTHGCFVGAVPIDAPELVVVVDVITRSSDYSGGTLAAPAFARIAERWLREAHGPSGVTVGRASP